MSSAIVLCLASDLYLKAPVDLQEVMWACYWGSLVIMFGVYFQYDILVSCGVVFFAGLGLPAWLLGLLLGNPLEPTSILIHTIPLIAGGIYVSKMKSLPRYSTLGAWLLYVIPLAVAWEFCDPEKKINLSHWIWPPAKKVLPRTWEFQALLLGTSAVTVFLAKNVIDTMIRTIARTHGSGLQPTAKSKLA